MSDFTGKLAFITGGSSGIGLETGVRLASMGCAVVIFARGREKLNEAVEIIKQRSGAPSAKIKFQAMDVSDHEEVTEKIKSAVEEHGIPDILINSAGLGSGDYFENISPQQFDRVMKINVYGTWNTISAVVPWMKKKGGGHIVNLSSLAGLIGMFGYSLYGTSKFAVTGMSEVLRAELKPHGIRVTLVCPPEVKTPFLQEEENTLPPEGRAVKTLAGLLNPEDVASAIVKGIKRKKFLIVPGIAAKFLYLNHRLSNGFLTRFFADIIAAYVRRKHKKN